MYIEKQNLTKKLKMIQEMFLTLVVAPVGCGKSTVVLETLKRKNMKYLWFNVTGLKDAQYLFLEVLNGLAKQNNSLVISDIKTILETPLEIRNFIEVINRVVVEDSYIVLYDFDDKYMQELITFLLQQQVHETVHHLHFIIVTTSLSNRDFIDAVYKKKCLCVTSEDFRWTEAEMKQLVKLHSISLSQEELAELYRYTEGWLPTIELALRSYSQYGSIFASSPIYGCVEDDLLGDCSDNFKEDLSKLSIVSDFSLELASALSNNPDVISFVVDNDANHMMFKKLGYNRYFLSTMMKDYLKYYLKAHVSPLAPIYQKAAQWYLNDNSPIKAIQTYLEGGMYEEIIVMLDASPISYMDIAPNLIQGVFAKMPVKIKYAHPFTYLRYVSDSMTNIDFHSGLKLLEQFKSDLDDHLYEGNRDQLLGEFYYVRAFSKFNDVEEMMKDFHLAYDLFHGEKSKVAFPNEVATFGSCHLLYLYHRTPGKLKSLVQTIVNEAKYYIYISHGVNTGSEHLAKAEYSFEIAEFKDVVMHARIAYQEAFKMKQISICIATLFLLGRYCNLMGNQKGLNAVVNELEGLREYCNVPVLQSELDCATSYINILMNRVNLVSTWVKEENGSKHSLFHEASSIVYVILISYHLKIKNFKEVLTYCELIEGYCEFQMHVFGMIYAKLGRVISYHCLNQIEDVMPCLEELLNLASEDGILAPFIENKEIIKEILLKYPIKNSYSDKVLEAISRYSLVSINEELLSTLTNKEKEIARIFCDSKSVAEVADSLFISKNTVKTYLKNIYKKLAVSSKEELIIFLGIQENRD